MDNANNVGNALLVNQAKYIIESADKLKVNVSNHEFINVRMRIDELKIMLETMEYALSLIGNNYGY